MKGRPDGVHNFSVTNARAHAHARDLVGLFWGFSGVSTRVSSAESLRPSAARMSVSCAVNRVQLWATPWKSCEKERAAVSVIDEQTRLDTGAQRVARGGGEFGIASSSSSGGSSFGICTKDGSLKGGHQALGGSSRVRSPWSHWAKASQGKGKGTWSPSTLQVPIGALPLEVLQPTTMRNQTLHALMRLSLSARALLSRMHVVLAVVVASCRTAIQAKYQASSSLMQRFYNIRAGHGYSSMLFMLT